MLANNSLHLYIFGFKMWLHHEKKNAGFSVKTPFSQTNDYINFLSMAL